MTTTITFSRQNDAGSRVSATNWENLVLVVVLVSERVPGRSYRIRHRNSFWESATFISSTRFIRKCGRIIPAGGHLKMLQMFGSSLNDGDMV